MSSFIVHPCTGPLEGHVTIPGDKSIGHRALMFAALTKNTVTITGLSDGEDNARTRRAIAALGADVTLQDDSCIVTGVGVMDLQPPSEAIECGNSGTTMRLLCGLLAGQRFDSTLIGDESLSRRPMRRIADPLSTMGAAIHGDGQGSKPHEMYPPLHIRGARTLTGIEYRLPMASAQVKSAVLLAGLYASGPTRVIEPGPSRDHTERMLAKMGAPLRVLENGIVEIDPQGWNRQLIARDLHVPGDPSSAAFIVAAAIVVGAKRVDALGVAINPTRTGFLDALSAMNANVTQLAVTDDSEPTATLRVEGTATLASTQVAGDMTVRAIDELPVLAVLAARANGNTVFGDAGELRVKESDRIATTAAMLRAFGIQVDEVPDGFTVHGRPDVPLRHATIDAAGDHRIAMAAAVASLVADGPVEIHNVDNVATSFPSFVDTMRTLGVRIDVV